MTLITDVSVGDKQIDPITIDEVVNGAQGHAMGLLRSWSKLAAINPTSLC